MAKSSIDITYVPADCGSIIPGKSKAPQAFRDVDIVAQLRETGIQVVAEHYALETPARHTNNPFQTGRARNEDVNIEVCKRVQRSLAQNLALSSSTRSAPFQLILGGECSMLPAIMSALWQHEEKQATNRTVGLLYVDADMDLSSPTDPGATGTLAGMNMTHLLHKEGALPSMKPFSRLGGTPVCSAANTVLFGINIHHAGNRREDIGFLLDGGYRVITSGCVASDPEGAAKQALDFLNERVDLIMVHFDVDSIDPGFFPLANVPNFTGVGYDVMMRALRVVLASDKVHGLCVAEVNPDHDPELDMVRTLTGDLVKMLAGKLVRE